MKRLIRGLRSRPEVGSTPPVRVGCIPIAEAPLGKLVRIHGDITSVILRPATTNRALEAEIDDGVDRLVIVWLGRTSIRGIEPGRGITVEGRVVWLHDQRMMHNPKYELAPRRTAE